MLEIPTSLLTKSDPSAGVVRQSLRRPLMVERLQLPALPIFRDEIHRLSNDCPKPYSRSRSCRIECLREPISTDDFLVEFDHVRAAT